jgi:hypothetical protein
MNLTNIPILSTALSIVISWALFAMLCSMIHEALVQVKAERGRFMSKYLLQQLNDASNKVNWGALLYAHGSIDLLSRATNKPANYISPKLFAQTMIEVVGKSQLVQRIKKVRNPRPTYTNPTLQDFKIGTSFLLQSDVMTFLKSAMNSAEITAAGLPNAEAVIYTELIGNLEKWFTDFQDRMTLWYQKITRVRLFLLGVTIAAIINIDSIQLFSFFNHSPEARTAVISYYQNNADKLADTSFSKLSLDQKQSFIKNSTQSLDSLSKKADLPVGFQYNLFHSHLPIFSLAFLWKLLGIMISGFAASFGGPFWYDLLKKIYTTKP